MSATPIYSYNPAPHRCSNRTVLSAVASRQIGFFEHQHLPRPLSSDEHRLYGPRHLRFSIRGVGGHRAKNSPWDEEPFKVLPSGKRAYLDEQDVVSFLDPPRDLLIRMWPLSTLANIMKHLALSQIPRPRCLWKHIILSAH